MSLVASFPLLHSINRPLFNLRIFSTKLAEAQQRTVRCNLKDYDLTSPDMTRRSANYQPCLWGYDFLVSLPTEDFTIDKHGEQREKMIAEVKEMIKYNCAMDPLSRLELVDAIERLGLKRHFQEEIKSSIETLYIDPSNYCVEDLYASALKFRVLRQHGYVIPEDIFDKFKDHSGNLCKFLSKDVRGLLSLYEASFMEWEGDSTLGEVRHFVARLLIEQLSSLPAKRAEEVQQELQLPLHWRFPRLMARWSIDAYDQYDQTHLLHPTLMRLAKLDYNILQSGYRGEIKRLAKWWKDLDLARKLPYSRDRLMVHYLGGLALLDEPQYRHCREMETKVICLITALDDTYDIYGTLEEVEIFTNLIDRWELSEVDRLPEPMRWCFLAIYNTSDQIADWTLKEKGFHIRPYLSKAWARLCKEYLQEAKWYREGYKPSLKEYLDHAIVSVSVHLILLVCYFLTAPTISKEALDYIDNLPNLLRCSGMIARLMNDLGTSSDELARGDTIKALECYMNETGASEKVAREYINGLINEAWKKMNEEYYLFCPQYPTTISDLFSSANLNFARVMHLLFSFKKDWHGKPDEEMMDCTKVLLINHVPMSN